ncbi:MAG: hypothetical protein KU29_12810 [Sulfurovum sp. FS06-10]|nr:MAG: hypothetical protein KU29_12810 [Sulfurovum sp. FS06-10]
MIDYTYLILYKMFRFILKVLPNFLIIWLMKLIAYFAYFVSIKHRRIIEQNLRLAFGDTLSLSLKKAIAIGAFRNLVDTTFGIMRRDGMKKSEVIENVTFEGSEIIQEYIQNGKIFILITGHYGNWELLSQAIAIKFNLHLVGVGRKLDSDIMDRVLKANRERFNVEMIYKKGAMKGALKAISQKKILGILTDQHISSSLSVDVNFFNHQATHTPLVSILSRKTGLDMIPAYISTEDYKHYVVKIYEPIASLKTSNQEEDFNKMTQAQATILEKVIIEKPNQWFWMHKRWKEKFEYEE